MPVLKIRKNDSWEEVFVGGGNGSSSEGGLPVPETAAVGQYIRVSAVDENGVVTAVEAVDTTELLEGLPSGEEATF